MLTCCLLLFQCPPHAVWVARYDGQIRTGGLLRLGASLFPVAKGAEWDMIPDGKFFLGMPKRPSDDFRPRRSPPALQILGAQRLCIGIG